MEYYDAQNNKYKVRRNPFLGAFAKLRKVMSVRPSARMEQLGS